MTARERRQFRETGFYPVSMRQHPAIPGPASQSRNDGVNWFRTPQAHGSELAAPQMFILRDGPRDPCYRPRAGLPSRGGREDQSGLVQDGAR